MRIRLIPRVRVNYRLRDLLSTLYISESKHVYRDKVKKILCQYFGVQDVLLTSSGRAGLFHILNYLPQRKVVIPAYTCKVVVEAVRLAQKEIIYAKTSSKTFNISELPLIDKDTIVIATHQYGLPCDINNMLQACRQSGAILVEDCAAALGTKINGCLAGTFGDFSFFSFDASKLINVPPKGGFIIAKDTNTLISIEKNIKYNEIDVKRFKTRNLIAGLGYCVLKNKILYRVFHYLVMGRQHKMHIYDNDEIISKITGYYVRPFYEWQAKVAYSQLMSVDKIIERRRKIYSYYHENIVSKYVCKPQFDEHASCIRYSILVDNQKEFYEKSLKRGVDMAFSFNHIICPNDYFEERKIAKMVLNVPFYYNLSKREQKRVVSVINGIKV